MDVVSSAVHGGIPDLDPAFQSRAALVELLAVGSGSAARHALTGTGGTGKTQLAAAYARRRVVDGWPVVWWLSARSEHQLVAGLAALADRAELWSASSDAFDAAERALRWLADHEGPCLVVYDDVEDEDLVARWSPRSGRVQVVAATSKGSVTGATALPVDVFTDSEALAYLRMRTGLDSGPDAAAVAAALDRLPLALACASTVAAGLLTGGWAVYRQLLDLTMHSQDAGHVDGESLSPGVAAAVQLALDDLSAVDPNGHARAVLDLLAVLSPAGVAGWLLRAAGEGRFPSADSAEVGVARVRAAVAVLAKQALLTTAGADGPVTVHPTVARVVRSALHRTGTLAQVLAIAVAVLITQEMEGPDAFRNRWQGMHLVDQAEALWTAAAPAGEPLVDHPNLIGYLLDRRGWAVRFLRDAGQPSRAIAVAHALVADRARLLGDDHPDTLTARNNLAYAYEKADRFADAAEEYRRVVADSARVLGDNHPETLITRSNVAYMYLLAGRYDEAIREYERVLAARTRVLGLDHPQTLTSIHNLANAFEQAGRVDEAIALLQHTLARRQRVLSPDHPETLAWQNNLALAYETAGRYDESIALQERILAARTRKLGTDDPEALGSRFNLAHAHESAGHMRKAITLYKRTLADRIRVLGPDHPRTHITREALHRAETRLRKRWRRR